MRPRDYTGGFGWIDCPAPSERAAVDTLSGKRKEEEMFRIQSTAPTTGPLTNHLAELRFDGRQATHHKTPTMSEQLRIVGRPTVVERQRSEMAQMRQSNHSVASAATVSQIVEQGLLSAQTSLQRLYRVAQQAKNESLTVAERQVLLAETRRLERALEEASQTAKFNGIPLLNGAQRALTFQFGGGYDAVEVHLSLMDTRPQTLLPGVVPTDVNEPGSAGTMSDIVRHAVEMVQERLEKITVFEERLQASLGYADGATRLTADRDTALQNAEEAQELVERARMEILSQPTNSIAVQAGLLSHGAMALINP